MGLFRGIAAPFRGAFFIARERLWTHLVAPVLVNVALGVAAWFAASSFFRRELESKLAGTPIVEWLATTFLGALGALLIFIVAQPILSAIFCDRLAEAVEKRVRQTAPRAPFLTSIGKALLHGVLKLALYGVAIALGLGLTLALAGIGTLIAVGIGTIFLAYDGFDYPLARREATFAEKWGYLLRHPGLALGFGLGSYFVYLIPFAFLVAPPFAAAGATLAFLDEEARARKASPGPAAEPPAPLAETAHSN